jgi:dephospho-CoA kinase
LTLFARPLAATLAAALRDTPVICLLGRRQSGKTTLARMLEPRYAYVSSDDDATLAFARADPTGFVAALLTFRQFNSASGANPRKRYRGRVGCRLRRLIAERT